MSIVIYSLYNHQTPTGPHSLLLLHSNHPPFSSFGLKSTSTPNLPLPSPSSLHPIAYPPPSKSASNSLSLIHCASAGISLIIKDPATRLACAAILHGFFGRTSFGLIVKSEIKAQTSMAMRRACRMRVETRFCLRREVEESVAMAEREIGVAVRFV